MKELEKGDQILLSYGEMQKLFLAYSSNFNYSDSGLSKTYGSIRINKETFYVFEVIDPQKLFLAKIKYGL